jgi:hypothetical protein
MNHETILQKFIALGIALSFIRRGLPGKFKNSAETLAKCNEIIEIFRTLPRWKKWVLNMILN